MQSSSSSQAALLTVCCLLVATEGLDAATSVLDRRISCIADSHYECGRQIGHKAAALIHQNINSNQSQHTLNRIDQWSKLDGGHRLAEYVQAQQDAYPQFIDEIRGIAEGSAVPFETLLRLNLESELTNEAGGSPPHSSGVGKACTDYHVIKQRSWVWHPSTKTPPISSRLISHYQGSHPRFISRSRILVVCLDGLGDSMRME